MNAPHMCLAIAEGQNISKTGRYPEGALLLDPIADPLGLSFELLDLVLYYIRTVWIGFPPTYSLNSLSSLAAMIKQHKSD